MKPIYFFILLGLGVVSSAVALEERHHHDSLDGSSSEHGHDGHVAHNDEDHHEHDHEDEVHAHADEHIDHNEKEHRHSEGDDAHHAHDEGGRDEHKEDGHGHGEEADHAELSEEQQAFAAIETVVVKKERLPKLINAPGEVVVNSYRTSAVTLRITAQVVKRHVLLGDRIKKGQPLVGLSSVAMAEAQGALLEAEIELRRVKELGRKVVSEKRFTAAQIAYQKAYSQVSAYGMSSSQIKALVKEGDVSQANGRFQLLSFQDGTIISDDFVIGQIVKPGEVLMQVTDESRLWFEARLPAGSAETIRVNADATVVVKGHAISGRVAQIHHLLDETTRTQAIYVEVENRDHQLHPGEFGTVSITSEQISEGIAVPTEAVLRNNKGEWRVFVETESGRFEPQVVNLVFNRGDQVVIEGVEEGARIVGRGAFFVQSEMAKSAFDTHNH